MKNRNINQEGARVLRKAATNGHLEIIHVLVKMGLSLDVIRKNLNLALRKSAENGHLEVVKLLVAEGSIGIMRYQAPTHRAEANGHKEVTAYLKQALAAYSRGQWNKYPPKP